MDEATANNLNVSVQCNPSYISLPRSPSPTYDSDTDSDDNDDTDHRVLDLKKSLQSLVANDHEIPRSAQYDSGQDEYDYVNM